MLCHILERIRFFLNKFQLFLEKGFDVESGRLPELRVALRNAGRALSESDKAIDHRGKCSFSLFSSILNF